MAGPAPATAAPVAQRPDMGAVATAAPAPSVPPSADVKPPAEAKPLAPVPLAKPPAKVAHPVDPATVVKITKILEELEKKGSVLKSREVEAVAGKSAVPPRPRTIDYPKFAAVKLEDIAKNIPGAKYMKETPAVLKVF